jgi:hypothetical protein
MGIDQGWFFLLAVAAGGLAVAAVGSLLRRRRHRRPDALAEKSAIGAWENEGGNPAPIPSTTPSP